MAQKRKVKVEHPNEEYRVDHFGGREKVVVRITEEPSDFDRKVDHLKAKIDGLQLRPEERVKFHEELDALKK